MPIPFLDIVSKLNIYKLDTHDRGFFKCAAENKQSRQTVESVGVLQINDDQGKSEFSEKRKKIYFALEHVFRNEKPGWSAGLSSRKVATFAC